MQPYPFGFLVQYTKIPSNKASKQNSLAKLMHFRAKKTDKLYFPPKLLPASDKQT